MCRRGIHYLELDLRETQRPTAGLAVPDDKNFLRLMARLISIILHNILSNANSSKHPRKNWEIIFIQRTKGEKGPTQLKSSIIKKKKISPIIFMTVIVMTICLYRSEKLGTK